MTEILQGKIDLYRCIHITDITLPSNFELVLENSLISWQSDGIRGVWLEIPSSQLELVSICKHKGFYLHHVSENGLVTAKWLANTQNKLPNYSSHYIGVGGVIFNNEGNILLVREMFDNSGIGQWKLPGGLVNANEMILEAACREVKEEVGINATPIGILCFREIRNYIFNKPDTYFIALLDAENVELLQDTEELTQICWKPFEEWLRETPIGEGRNMLARLYGDSQESPKELFRKIALKNQEYEYETPNFTKTISLHLPFNTF
ncbi:unnamed protein product [Blepharisma stoltei]|uniref:Nudix hydrolase domain-containing protein n=1 Tax=Blepharisma stoltei TaxID=1481888 RepID=A0AAU9K216_9CILI|nr:unnamed protein product [Blepharisma stoltei]